MDVRGAIFGEGFYVDLCINSDLASKDIELEVPGFWEKSGQLNVAKNLKKGRNLNFTGTFNDIHSKILYFNDARLYPQ